MCGHHDRHAADTLDRPLEKAVDRDAVFGEDFGNAGDHAGFVAHEQADIGPDRRVVRRRGAAREVGRAGFWNTGRTAPVMTSAMSAADRRRGRAAAGARTLSRRSARYAGSR